jgi:hypothetical protein
MIKKRSPHLPIEDTRRLISELDKLVARRPNGNPVLPPLIFINSFDKKKASARIVPNNYWVSTDTSRPTIPHTLSLLDQTDMDDITLFIYLYDNLKIPHSMGKFRFTHLKMAISLLSQKIDPGAMSRDAKINDIVNKLHQPESQFLHRSTALISNTDNYDGLLGFIAIIFEAIRRIRFKFFSAQLQTTKRYRWFTDRVALELTRQSQIDEVSQDFLSCAIWTLQYARQPNSPLVRELLMLALFEDLEYIYRQKWIDLSWRRRRRTTPFVVTLKDVAKDNSAGRRFLSTFGELIGQSKGSGLLLLASIHGKVPKSLEAEIDTFRTAADKLHLIRHGRYESSAINAFNIELNVPLAQQEVIQEIIVKRPSPKPKLRWQDFTLPGVIGLILLPFIIAGSIYAFRAVPSLYQATQQCKYMHTQKDEIVGITDGSCSFLTRSDARSIGYSETSSQWLRRIQIWRDGIEDFSHYITSLGVSSSVVVEPERLSYIDEINSTKNIILSQNKLIRESDDYRTIVLLLPFTSPDESGHVNQKTIGIMRGVAVIQEEINENAEKVSSGTLGHLKLKILIANTGNKLSYGQKVAEDIRRLNENGLPHLTKKHSIIAVAGITQSTAEAKRTVNVLTAPGPVNNPAIPVVGSTLTYDYMSEGDPLFYQAAAPNKRQAQILAEFIRHQPIVGDVSGNTPELLQTTRNMVIISDNNDWYSQNLADDLYSEFMNEPDGTHAVLKNWSVINGDNRDSDPHLKNIAEVTSLSHIQSELCNPDILSDFDQQQDIVIYTGRSQNFSTFLNSLKPDVCARGKGFTILAGSDVAQWGEYSAFKNFFPYLYFGAYGARGNDHNGAVADTFFANPTVNNIVDQSGAARAYDSIKLIWSIVQTLNAPVDTIDTTLMLKKISDKNNLHIEFEGASGVLSIPLGEQVPINKPVLIMRAGSSEPVLSCGAFSIQPSGSSPRINTHGQPFIETLWGKERQFNCP